MEEGRGEAIYDVGLPLVDSDENGTAGQSVSQKFRESECYRTSPPFPDGGGGGPPTEGLTDAEYDASVATLESVAATLNAKCVVLREKRLDEAGKRT